MFPNSYPNVPSKPIPGYPGYRVSSCGQVLREDGYALKPYLFKGRLLICLKNAQGKRLAVGVHRLVYLAWVGEPGANTWLRHKNGNKQDNRLENLELMTGDRRCFVKQTTSRQLEAHRLTGLGLSQREVAKRLGISQPSVCELLGRFRANSSTDTGS